MEDAQAIISALLPADGVSDEEEEFPETDVSHMFQFIRAILYQIIFVTRFFKDVDTAEPLLQQEYQCQQQRVPVSGLFTADGIPLEYLLIEFSFVNPIVGQSNPAESNEVSRLLNIR
jgi:hypothetical protein